MPQPGSGESSKRRSTFGGDRSVEWCGGFSVRAEGAAVIVTGADHRELRHEGPLTFTPTGAGRFTLHDVTIGVKFHWERKEDQTFEGGLRLVPRGDGTLSVVNEVPLEAYLASVISSEMSATAPAALLEAHAITSRSWLVAMLERAARKTPPILPPPLGEGERWSAGTPARTTTSTTSARTTTASGTRG